CHLEGHLNPFVQLLILKSASQKIPGGSQPFRGGFNRVAVDELPRLQPALFKSQVALDLTQSQKFDLAEFGRAGGKDFLFDLEGHVYLTFGKIVSISDLGEPAAVVQQIGRRLDRAHVNLLADLQAAGFDDLLFADRPQPFHLDFVQAELLRRGRLTENHRRQRQQTQLQYDYVE